VSAKQFADRAFHEFSRKTHYKNGSPFLLASASASDQTLRVCFRAFYKMRSPFQSLTQEIPTPSAAFLPSVSAKRQSEIPSKTKTKSSKKNCVFHISSSLHLQFDF